MSESIQTVPGLTVETSINVLTPEYIRANYITGLTFVDANGNLYPDSWYWTHIRAAVSTFERETQIAVLRRTITDEQHDYNASDYVRYAFVNLFMYPVVQVLAVGAQYPTGQKIMDFPPEWFRIDELAGQIQLVPTAGTLSQVMIGQGGAYLPMIFSTISYMPKLWHVDYIAGFAEGKVPWDIIDTICKLASVNLLSVAAQDILPPGVTSVSVGTDGVSQSTGYMNNGQLPPVFTGLINMYRKDLYGGPGDTPPGQLKRIRDFYRGIQMIVG